MREKARPPTFSTEAELCEAFLKAVALSRASALWTSYPETADYDILMVRNDDGVQVGIEAKMRINVDVIDQAIDSYRWQKSGPDYRAILVPADSRGRLGGIARFIGVAIIRCGLEYWTDYRQSPPTQQSRPTFRPDLPSDRWADDAWHDWWPATRCEVPDYVPSVAAGVPSPVKLTPWKVGALKIVALLGARAVTRSDFRAIGIDPSRWLAPGTGWLVKGRSGWVRGPTLPPFAEQHPDTFAEIVATIADWAPEPGKAPIRGQGNLFDDP